MAAAVHLPLSISVNHLTPSDKARIAGVGPVVALTYRATVDVPVRFKNSKAVGAVLGLTPSKYQSGEINRPVAYHGAGTR